MGKFTYSGPMSAATLDDGTDVILFPGADVTLPSGNAWVKSLVAQRLLTPVAAEKASAGRSTPKPKPEAPTPVAAEKEGK